MKGKSPKRATLNPPWVLIACGTAKERTRWRRALLDKFTVLEVDGRSSPKRLIAKLNSPVVLLDLNLQQPGRSNAPPAIERLRHLTENMLIPGTQVLHEGKLGVRSNVIHQLLEEVTPLNEHPHKDSGSSQSPLALLTPRKQEIARLIATGASNKEIANDLHISEATVKAQLTDIFRILHLSGRLQLALFLTKQSQPSH
jgi:DNA-binding CsgD family transcriptional regulator